MPYAHANGIRIYYEIHGQGEPLVMVHGLGAACNLWSGLLPALAEHFQAVVFDNRGIGRTDAPEYPYTIPMMAADTIGLMDVLEIESAHLFGFSMGGWIVQQIALDHPDRVRGLVLGSTSYSPQVVPEEIIQDIFRAPALPPEEGLPILMRCFFAQKTIDERPDVIDEWKIRREEFPQSEASAQNQGAAGFSFNSLSSLNQITSPTLVIGGRDDRCFPMATLKEMADAIPGAELVFLDDAGHSLFAEQPELGCQHIVRFLSSL
jgi:pimeloyl-ACP methyl ester carboxylesterase